MVFVYVSYILPDKQEIWLEGSHHFVPRFRQNDWSSDTRFGITIYTQFFEFSLFNPDIIIAMNTFASEVFWPENPKRKNKYIHSLESRLSPFFRSIAIGEAVTLKVSKQSWIVTVYYA